MMEGSGRARNLSIRTRIHNTANNTVFVAERCTLLSANNTVFVAERCTLLIILYLLQSGAKLGLIPSSMSAMVDLRGQLTGFRELFYVVLAEKERIINIIVFFI
jgi:hypothetical protein